MSIIPIWTDEVRRLGSREQTMYEDNENTCGQIHISGIRDMNKVYHFDVD
jgi:hypothetical protein